MAADPAKPPFSLNQIAVVIGMLAAIGTIAMAVRAFIPEPAVTQTLPGEQSTTPTVPEPEEDPPAAQLNKEEATSPERGASQPVGLDGFDIEVEAAANMEDAGPDKFEISRWIGHRSDLSVEWGGIDNSGKPVDPGDCAIVVEVRVDGEFFGQEFSGDCAGSVDFKSISQPGTYDIRIHDETSGTVANKSVVVAQTHERR